MSDPNEIDIKDEPLPPLEDDEVEEEEKSKNLVVPSVNESSDKVIETVNNGETIASGVSSVNLAEDATSNNSTSHSSDDAVIPAAIRNLRRSSSNSDHKTTPELINIEEIPEDYFAELIGLETGGFVVDEWEEGESEASISLPDNEDENSKEREREQRLRGERSASRSNSRSDHSRSPVQRSEDKQAVSKDATESLNAKTVENKQDSAKDTGESSNTKTVEDKQNSAKDTRESSNINTEENKQDEAGSSTAKPVNSVDNKSMNKVKKEPVSPITMNDEDTQPFPSNSNEEEKSSTHHDLNLNMSQRLKSEINKSNEEVKDKEQSSSRNKQQSSSSDKQDKNVSPKHRNECKRRTSKPSPERRRRSKSPNQSNKKRSPGRRRSKSPSQSSRYSDRRRRSRSPNPPGQRRPPPVRRHRSRSPVHSNSSRRRSPGRRRSKSPSQSNKQTTTSINDVQEKTPPASNRKKNKSKTPETPGQKRSNPCDVSKITAETLKDFKMSSPFHVLPPKEVSEPVHEPYHRSYNERPSYSTRQRSPQSLMDLQVVVPGQIYPPGCETAVLLDHHSQRSRSRASTPCPITPRHSPSRSPRYRRSHTRSPRRSSRSPGYRGESRKRSRSRHGSSEERFLARLRSRRSRQKQTGSPVLSPSIERKSLRRSQSPHRESLSRRRSPDADPRRRSPSPRRRSQSPRRRSKSPRRRSKSPRRRSISPRRRSRSPPQRRRRWSPPPPVQPNSWVQSHTQQWTGKIEPGTASTAAAAPYPYAVYNQPPVADAQQPQANFFANAPVPDINPGYQQYYGPPGYAYPPQYPQAPLHPNYMMQPANQYERNVINIATDTQQHVPHVISDITFVPQQHVPQQHVPQQHVPQQHLPQQHVPPLMTCPVPAPAVTASPGVLQPPVLQQAMPMPQPVPQPVPPPSLTLPSTSVVGAPLVLPPVTSAQAKKQAANKKKININLGGVQGRPALRTVDLKKLTNPAPAPVLAPPAPIPAAVPPKLPDSMQPYELPSLSDTEESSSSEEEEPGEGMSLSSFLQARIEARESGNKPPFKVYVADRVESTIRTLEADPTIMRLHRFIVTPRDDSTEVIRTPRPASVHHCSPLLRNQECHFNINIQQVNTRAIKLQDKPSFIPRPKPVPKSILKPGPTTVSIGVNTDPMPEPVIPECLKCSLRNEMEFMNRWTQTLPPVRHSAFVQVGRDMETFHNPGHFRFQNRLAPQREVILVDQEQDDAFGFQRFPNNRNLDRPVQPPSPPRINLEQFPEKTNRGPETFPSRGPENFKTRKPETFSRATEPFSSRGPNQFSSRTSEPFSEHVPESFPNRGPESFSKRGSEFSNHGPDSFSKRDPESFPSRGPESFPNRAPEQFSNRGPDPFSSRGPEPGALPYRSNSRDVDFRPRSRDGDLRPRSRDEDFRSRCRDEDLRPHSRDGEFRPHSREYRFSEEDHFGHQHNRYIDLDAPREPPRRDIRSLLEPPPEDERYVRYREGDQYHNY